MRITIEPASDGFVLKNKDRVLQRYSTEHDAQAGYRILVGLHTQISPPRSTKNWTDQEWNDAFRMLDDFLDRRKAANE